MSEPSQTESDDSEVIVLDGAFDLNDQRKVSNLAMRAGNLNMVDGVVRTASESADSRCRPCVYRACVWC